MFGAGGWVEISARRLGAAPQFMLQGCVLVVCISIQRFPDSQGSRSNDPVDAVQW